MRRGSTGFDERELLLVHRRWEGRGHHTSVERFADQFPDAWRLTTADLWGRPNRVLHRLSAATGQAGYSSASVELELRAVLRTLRRRPRVVHFLYGDHDFHHAGRALHRLGAKVVLTLYFSIEELERRMPDKAHLAHADLVLATGAEQQAHLAQFVPAERLGFLPLGVDTGFFTPPAGERPAARLLQVGRNRRDVEVLRDVVVALRGERPDLRLLVVGYPELADQLGPVDGVDYAGHLDDDGLLEAYRSSTLLVLPLLEGGSSNALNEALATGLPVVATDRPNLVDYVGDGAVALCPPGDAGAMTAACRELLDDADRRATASAAARQHALGLDWSVVRAALVEHYEALLAR
jgi:glycosyltransferase involved in cell wall biosynthesis